MKRTVLGSILSLLLAMLLLAALVRMSRPAAAAGCFLHESGVYVCDARPSLAPFSTPRYAANSILWSNTYSWIEDYAPLYEAPQEGAKLVEQVTEGILYNTIKDTVTDASGNRWYKIRDAWAGAEDVHVIEESHFAGVEVHSDPERPFGWVLYKHRPAPAPGAEAAEDDPWIERYTFIEVYDVVEAEDGWSWYDIGGGRWVKQTRVALVDFNERPDGVAATDFWVDVDLYEQVFAAYEGDHMVYAGLISSGLDRWPTNEGLYPVYARKMETPMYGGEVGDDYYFLDDVPHTMFFDEDIALHGAYWHDDFGQQRSHGCVNMPPRDAEWVFFWSENAPNDLLVWVHTSPEDHFLQKYGSALAAQAGLADGQP